MMWAFNALNGVPSTANRYLLTNVLRDRWGFDGFVVSDYTAIRELRNHGIALDGATAARKAITAGVDVDMMSHLYDTELPGRSVRPAPMIVVDEAVRRVLRVKFALGLFEASIRGGYGGHPRRAGAPAAGAKGCGRVDRAAAEHARERRARFFPADLRA